MGQSMLFVYLYDSSVPHLINHVSPGRYLPVMGYYHHAKVFLSHQALQNIHYYFSIFRIQVACWLVP